MSSELTMWADRATRMGTAATTTAAILTMATPPPITMAPHTTVGLTIRGRHRLLMDGVGAGRRGTAATVLYSHPFRGIPRPRFVGRISCVVGNSKTGVHSKRWLDV